MGGRHIGWHKKTERGSVCGREVIETREGGEVVLLDVVPQIFLKCHDPMPSNEPC